MPSLALLITTAPAMVLSTTSRAVAHRVLQRCTDGGMFVERAFESVLSRHSLQGDDQARATAIVHGVLRHRRSLDYYLGQLLDSSRVQQVPTTLALRIGAYELLHTTTPAYLAVDSAVNLVKPPSQRRFVNGVLRALSNRRHTLLAPRDDPTLTPLRGLAIATSTPDWLLRDLLSDGGGPLPSFAELERWAHATQRRPELALRVNRLRTNRDDLTARLVSAGSVLSATPPPLPDTVLVTAAGREVSALPGFAEGAFTVQDVGAQCVALLAAPPMGGLTLDLCAAPGGKTCHVSGE